MEKGRDFTRVLCVARLSTKVLSVKKNKCFFGEILKVLTLTNTSVQAGAVLMPLAMFLLSLKSIRVLY